MRYYKTCQNKTQIKSGFEFDQDVLRGDLKERKESAALIGPD